MPAKINVTNHTSLHTRSWLHEVLPKSCRSGTTLGTGHQDDNKNTYEANTLCGLTFKVFQKHTFFRIIHLQPPSPKRPVAETTRRRNLSPKTTRRRNLSPKRLVAETEGAAPNRSRRNGRRAVKFVQIERNKSCIAKEANGELQESFAAFMPLV